MLTDFLNTQGLGLVIYGQEKNTITKMADKVSDGRKFSSEHQNK